MSDEAIEYQKRIAREEILIDATVKHWWQKKWFIVKVMVTAMTIFIAILLLLPKLYKAEASIIVMPPRFVPEIRTQPFSITTTQQLLETPELYQQVILHLRRYRHVLTRLVGSTAPSAEVVAKLAGATLSELMSDSRITREDAQVIADLDQSEIRGILQFDNDELADMTVDKMAKMLTSQESVEKKTAADLTYSPVLRLYAVSDTGNKAQVIVNLWAKLFERKYEALTHGQTQRLNESLENQQEAGQNELENIQKILVEFKLQNNLELIQHQIADYTENFSAYHKQVAAYTTELIDLESKARSLTALVSALEDEKGSWIGTVFIDGDTSDPLSPQLKTIEASALPENSPVVVQKRRSDALQSRKDLMLVLETAATFNRNNPIELMVAERKRMEQELLQEKTNYRANLVESEVASKSLAQLNASIDSTSQTISLMTALPDEILGEILTSDRLEDVQKVTSVHLNKQQINPVWETMVSQRADVSRSLREAEATIEELSGVLVEKELELRALDENIFKAKQAQALVASRVEREEETNKKLFSDYARMKEEVFSTGWRITLLKEQIASLNTGIKDSQNRIESLRNSYEAAAAEMEILELRKKAVLERAELLTQKLQESLVAIGEELSDVSTAARAVPPSRHFFPPRTMLFAAMTFLTGSVLLGGMSRKRYRELMAAS